MQSELVPGFVYRDVGSDITETDLDVVSDLWTIDGREVYRGSRDPRYTHANVYWLYSDTLERVGLCEHNRTDQADFRALWMRDTEFGTYLAEDGWERGEDIWSVLPRHVFDRFVNEGWTVPDAFLEQCLHGPLRIFTPAMLETLPLVYTCSKCGKKSLKPSAGCTMTSAPLDFPQSEKVFFVDFDMVVHRPPMASRIWDLLTQPSSRPSGGSQEREQAQEQQPEALSPPSPPAAGSPPHPEPQTLPVPEQEHASPPQSHP
jgi:hypothetical protein